MPKILKIEDIYGITGRLLRQSHEAYTQGEYDIALDYAGQALEALMTLIEALERS